jgi:HlyD family secretion protein
MRSVLRILALLLPSLLLPLPSAVVGAPPYLSGIIEDVGSQVIEMPRLPGAWQRTVAWMAPEGSTVDPGDLIVQLDPGTLIASEEQMRTDLEKRAIQAERRAVELQLAILNAEIAVAQADSAVRLAKTDADIPESTIPQLDYERHQLALATASKALEHAQAELVARQEERTSTEKVIDLQLAKAQTEWQRMRDAMDKINIRAAQSGYFIYAESRITGAKIFPGETLQTNAKIAEVASREGLKFRLWVHEADIRRFTEGSPILVTPDAFPDQSVTAVVDWASKQAIQRPDWSPGGYFELTAVPDETVPQDFMPGMSVMAEREP